MADPRVLRVIARMNVGGPAHHVALLSGRMQGYDTLLVSGKVGAGEGSAEALATRHGARLATLPGLRPEISPPDDLRALLGLVRVIRRTRPALVHTHTAKAGLLGRTAAVLAGRPRPVIVHTFHGHVLEGYFGPLQTGFYRAVERALARVSDRLIGVSEATVDDLVRLGVAPREKFSVVPLGLDLDPFLELPEPAGDGPPVALYVGRLVPIKRVDRLVRAAAATGVRIRIAGDGELRGELEALAQELGAPVEFLGFRSDVAELLAQADFAVLSSDNEGTPVALIEAGAAGRPAVATDVGGVRDVVTARTGIVVDEEDLAEAIAELATDRERRLAMGRRAREHVRSRYAWQRLVRDVEGLYAELLA
jgi:glycosyltransferase involved in cell wall biosynthesis